MKMKFTFTSGKGDCILFQQCPIGGVLFMMTSTLNLFYKANRFSRGITQALPVTIWVKNDFQ